MKTKTATRQTANGSVVEKIVPTLNQQSLYIFNGPMRWRLIGWVADHYRGIVNGHHMFVQRDPCGPLVDSATFAEWFRSVWDQQRSGDGTLFGDVKLEAIRSACTDVARAAGFYTTRHAPTAEKRTSTRPRHTVLTAEARDYVRFEYAGKWRGRHLFHIGTRRVPSDRFAMHVRERYDLSTRGTVAQVQAAIIALIRSTYAR